MLVLVVDGVAQRNSRRRFVARVGVGHRPCNDINIACIGVAVKSNLQRAARVGVGADDRGAYADVAALEVHARRARPRKTKHVLRVGAPVPANGQHRPAPVGIEVKFGVNQIDVGVEGDRGVLGVVAMRQVIDRWCIVDIGGHELEGAGGAQVARDTADPGTAVAQVFHLHGEGDCGIAVGVAGREDHVVAGGVDRGAQIGQRSRQRDCAGVIGAYRQARGRGDIDRPGTDAEGHGVVIQGRFETARGVGGVLVVLEVEFARLEDIAGAGDGLEGACGNAAYDLGRIVDRHDGDGDDLVGVRRVSIAPIRPGVVAVGDDDPQCVSAVVVGGAQIAQIGKGGIQLGLGALQRHGVGTHCPRANRGSAGHGITGGMEIQPARAHGQRDGVAGATEGVGIGVADASQ